MKQYLNVLLPFTLLIAACTDSETERINTNKPDTVVIAPKEEPKEVKKTEKEEEPERTERVEIQLNQQDRSLLMLADQIALGTDYQKIKEQVPNLKEIRPEGNSDVLAAEGLTEATASASFMEKQTGIEFNFKNDSLYSFYYLINELNTEKGERLYKGIRTYYLERWGEGKKMPVEEETHYSTSYYWELGNGRFGVMTYNLNTGNISWGVQNTKP